MNERIDLAEAIRAVPMPDRLKKLPLSDKGFPIPAFVAWLDIEKKRYLPEGTRGAVRDFLVVNDQYMDRCYRLLRCWICGEPLGRHRIFAMGPMCAVSGTTMEPPSHRDCVEYAARACPFLINPRMRRNEKGLPDDVSAPGMMIDRNPGATALWETESYHRFQPPGGGLLCRFGEPRRVDWWTQGRPATRAEALAAIDSGMPILLGMARQDGPEGVREIEDRYKRVLGLLPAT
jgi:hypothetical protein